jgi:putative Holliday junction resolvase
VNEVVIPGVRLAVDVGSVRIGLARSDPHGILATPLAAVPAGEGAVAQVAAQARECEAVEIIVGLPIGLNGAEGQAAAQARDWAKGLTQLTEIPVLFVDERLSTVQAQRGLREAGRSIKTSRAIIDSASAVVLLQSYVDGQKRGSEQ